MQILFFIQAPISCMKPIFSIYRGILSLVPSLSVKILCWVVVIDILLNAILFIILYCLFRQKRNKKTSPRAV